MRWLDKRKRLRLIPVANHETIGKMKSVKCLAWLAIFLGTMLAGSVLAASGNSSPSSPHPEHLVWIKPGTFTMGSPSTIQGQDRISKERPQTQVTISQGFGMSQYETTQGEYLAVMGTNSSYFTGDLKRPVEQVTWYDATNYCVKLTSRERVAGRLPSGYAWKAQGQVRINEQKWRLSFV